MSDMPEGLTITIEYRVGTAECRIRKHVFTELPANANPQLLFNAVGNIAIATAKDVFRAVIAQLNERKDGE